MRYMGDLTLASLLGPDLQSGNCCPNVLRRQMGLPLRHPDRAVAEEVSNLGQRYAGRHQPGRAGVAEGMDEVDPKNWTGREARPVGEYWP
jgi:hypothetical protein